MKIENQEKNLQNMAAIREDLLRSPDEDSLFAAMLNKYDATGESFRFPPLVIAGIDLRDLEAKMQNADWTHSFSDDFVVDERGNAQVQLIFEDLKLLAETPEGNRVAFYLCDRWMPKGLYNVPDFIREIPNELQLVFENKENEENYKQLKGKLFRQYGPAYRVLGMFIKVVEEYFFIDVPPPVINGVDIVKLEGEIHYAGPQGAVDLFKVDKNSSERTNSIRNQLKTISQHAQGERVAFQFVNEYGLIEKSLLFQQLQERSIHDILADTTLIKYEQSNIRSMETNQVSYDEKELQRIAESLKYAGLKEVPRELIVDLLVKNQDKSIVKWDKKKEAVSSSVNMYFNKTNEKQYLNGFAVALSKDGKQFFRRYNRIEFGNTLTYTQTLNMAEGRSIGREWMDKDETGKIVVRYFAAAAFDLNDKDEKGNPKLVQYRGTDPGGIVHKYPIDFSAHEKSQEYFMEGVLRGNLTECSVATKQGPVALMAYYDARENDLVFKRTNGDTVTVTVKDNIAAVRDLKPDLEKKNDVKQAKQTSQRTGKGKDKDKPDQEGTRRNRRKI